MRLNDIVASTIQALADLLVLCPDEDREKTAEVFERIAKVLGGTASWLSGQAVLLRGQSCEACAGMGNLNGETCRECGGTGRKPGKGGGT